MMPTLTHDICMLNYMASKMFGIIIIVEMLSNHSRIVLLLFFSHHTIHVCVAYLATEENWIN